MDFSLQQYLMQLKNKKVLVLGIGVSNRPLIRMLLAHGIQVTACDKTAREDAQREILELEELGAVLKLGKDYLQNLQGDIVFRSPGIRPDIPELLQLREQGAVITSEMEVFFQVCPCPIIAVTGSDGKTTTTTVITKILEHSGKRVWLGGNIGRPLLTMAGEMQAEDIAVVELSSFQLLTMNRSAHVAVITNLAPNHLDYHKVMEEYVAAKSHVFLYQSAGDKLVINRDNELTDGFTSLAKGSVVKFSRRERSDCYLQGDTVYLHDTPVLNTKDIIIPGLHNVENYMAAILATEEYAAPEDIREVARTFEGVEHRIEFVRTYHGAKFYNDSIASSPTRTIAGLHTFPDKVILLAGGKDKGVPFDELGEEICQHVKSLVLCGATAEAIEKAVRSAPSYREGNPAIITETDFKKAVETAASQANEGEVVTLSPACTAFDRFKNFMERGEVYKKIVLELE